MELGVTSFADTPPDLATGVMGDHGIRLRQVLAEIELAEEVGLDVYALGEHHRRDMAASAPAITLAAAAGRTARIRLSSAVIILSSADPVRTYQDFATLDLLSAGRAELLVGRGSFIESFPLFGFSLEDYHELFEEKLELLLEITRSEQVTWSGRFRPPLENAAIYPRAHQDPLPVWVGVGGSPESMMRAGRLGLPVALAIIGGDPARFRVLVDIYRRSLVEAGHDPDSVPLAVHAIGHVADTAHEAVEDIYPTFSATMTRIGRERGWPPMSRAQYDWMAGPEGSLVVGDPETVATKILRWQEMLGFDRFSLQNGGAPSHDKLLRSIELFGSKGVATRPLSAPGPAPADRSADTRPALHGHTARSDGERASTARLTRSRLAARRRCRRPGSGNEGLGFRHQAPPGPFLCLRDDDPLAEDPPRGGKGTAGAALDHLGNAIRRELDDETVRAPSRSRRRTAHRLANRGSPSSCSAPPPGRRTSPRPDPRTALLASCGLCFTHATSICSDSEHATAMRHE